MQFYTSLYAVREFYVYVMAVEFVLLGLFRSVLSDEFCIEFYFLYEIHWYRTPYLVLDNSILNSIVLAFLFFLLQSSLIYKIVLFTKWSILLVTKHL